MHAEFMAGILQTCQQSRQKLEHCFQQLNPDQIWYRTAPEQNSIGNLVLHISGNLRQWGIVPFTGAEDLRDRESEFAHSVLETEPLLKEPLLNRLEVTLDEAKGVWRRLQEADLVRGYKVQGFEVTGCFAILHTVTHFVGHTHQVITLTRQQLGSAYRFHWTPDKPRTDVPI